MGGGGGVGVPNKKGGGPTKKPKINKRGRDYYLELESRYVLRLSLNIKSTRVKVRKI